MSWYKSDELHYLGISMLILSFGLGIGSCRYLSKDEPEVQASNLVGEEIPEKFYLVDDKICVFEIDGKPVLEKLVSDRLEK